MHLRPLHSLSRILLVTCAVGLGTTALFAGTMSSSSTAPDSTQTPPQPTQDQSSSSAPAAAPAAPAPSTAPQAPYASRIDIFAGYSYLAPHGTVTIPGGNLIGVTGPLTYSAVNLGAIGSGTYYFDRYVGAQIEVSVHPDGNNDGATVASGGIVFRYPTEDVTPFVHFEAGGVRLGGPYKQPYTWGPSHGWRRSGLRDRAITWPYASSRRIISITTSILDRRIRIQPVDAPIWMWFV